MIFQAFVFDFQPKDPENIYVALAALSRKVVPGEPINILLFAKFLFVAVKLVKIRCSSVPFYISTIHISRIPIFIGVLVMVYTAETSHIYFVKVDMSWFCVVIIEVDLVIIEI